LIVATTAITPTKEELSFLFDDENNSSDDDLFVEEKAEVPTTSGDNFNRMVFSADDDDNSEDETDDEDMDTEETGPSPTPAPKTKAPTPTPKPTPAPTPTPRISTTSAPTPAPTPRPTPAPVCDFKAKMCAACAANVNPITQEAYGAYCASACSATSTAWNLPACAGKTEACTILDSPAVFERPLPTDTEWLPALYQCPDGGECQVFKEQVCNECANTDKTVPAALATTYNALCAAGCSARTSASYWANTFNREAKGRYRTCVPRRVEWSALCEQGITGSARNKVFPWFLCAEASRIGTGHTNYAATPPAPAPRRAPGL